MVVTHGQWQPGAVILAVLAFVFALASIGGRMQSTLKIRPEGALDFLALGALIHRLDPGIIPFRKATECHLHWSGGEFNGAANLADCFPMNTAIASAIVAYPIGDLGKESVPRMGGRGHFERSAAAVAAG